MKEPGKRMSLVTSSPTTGIGPSDVLDQRASKVAICSKISVDATKKLPGERFDRDWPLLIRMNETVTAKVEKHFIL
jgi:3-polyprenyl-4-hydroxybenzoate decarboxylase